MLGGEASRYVQSLRLNGKLFPFLTSLNSILTYWTFFFRFLDLCTKCIGVFLANKKRYKLNSNFRLWKLDMVCFNNVSWGQSMQVAKNNQYLFPVPGHTFIKFLFNKSKINILYHLFCRQYDNHNFGWSCPTSLNVFKVRPRWVRWNECFGHIIHVIIYSGCNLNCKCEMWKILTYIYLKIITEF